MHMLRDKFPFYIFIVIMALTGCSSSENDVIPSDKMSLIIADFYMSDQYIALEPAYKGEMDTTLLYETVTERYGYTFEDYLKAMEYYLQKGDMLKRIYTQAKERLIRRRDELAIQNAKIESYNEALRFFEMKKADQLWKEPDLRAIYHLSGIKVKQEWDIRDTTTADNPQNSKWWIYNLTASRLADSLYPAIAREYLLNDKNSKTATLWYREGDAEEWLSTPLTLEAYEGSGASVIFSASAEVSWELYIEITDDFESTVSAVQNVSSKPIILSISKEGTGVAIGEAAEEDGVLSVALPTVFKGHATFENGLSMEPVEQDGWRILTRNDGSVELMKVFTYESTPYSTREGWSYHQYSLDFPLEMETDYVCIVSWRANNSIMIDGGNSYRTSGSCRIYGATQNSETQTVTSQVLVIGRRA